MRYVDEFRDPELIIKASEEIYRLADPDRHYRIMEVCGGHTHAIYRFGLKDILPSNIELIHGPGCPVCVLPMGRIDDGLTVATNFDVIFAAFGDMMRVPGTQGSPFEHKARGTDVRIVYSPADALQIARKNPEKHVMFFAIGFETTAPSTALTLMRAKSEGITNFSVFCNHVTIVPAIRAILDSPDMRLDAFIGPGHVSTVIGCRPYEWIARSEGKPVVTSGFEPLDLLQSLVMLLRQLRAGEARVENQYKRVVPWEGNRAALKAMAEIFQLRPYFEWRGLGFISQSALRIRDEYAEWDAEQRFPIPGTRVTDPKAAQCGEVLKGVLKPAQCKLFGKECTPEHPIGALMVSTEGSCAAYYNYEHRKAAMVTSISSVA
ncbi:hydrogenase formation protein HypD [Alloacidobacterium dinghuense]|uniref:Hydrogenase formation protein HypD n=1 Tax=Alloacidobacterium dinghuense TaxID=2763107 RepID=A0A7G8BC94_9BACT|nr:hydrogenase formation protein HypD [Alloacidobacterium dinghuense]QNI30164.1 hydrogenase formation protein HypD [Alloacidobacterium dinghuense]